MRNKLRLTASSWRHLTVAAFSFIASLSCSAVLFAEEAAEAESNLKVSLNPLDSFRTDLALWTGVVFLLLLFVLWKFAFGPIVKALDAREQSMIDQVNSAEKANADAKELLNQYQQKLADSEQEVHQMLEDAKSQAKRVGEGIVASAKAAADEEQQKALKEIAAASDNAKAELAAKSAELATSLAGKILKQQINPEDHASLIKGALNEFTQE